MHFKKHSIVAAVVVMLAAANAGAIKVRDDGDASVDVPQDDGQSPSIPDATVPSAIDDVPQVDSQSPPTDDATVPNTSEDAPRVDGQGPSPDDATVPNEDAPQVDGQSPPTDDATVPSTSENAPQVDGQSPPTDDATVPNTSENAPQVDGQSPPTDDATVPNTNEGVPQGDSQSSSNVDATGAIVVMHQVVSQSPSIVYATVTSSVKDCGTISCPVSTSTIVELTTYCPVTMTETSTIGTPTDSGPLSTITTSVTVPNPGETSSASIPSESGPNGAPPAETTSGAAASGPSPSDSVVGVPGAISVSPESTGPASESTSLTTIVSTSFLLTTVTVAGSTDTETQTLTTGPSAYSSSYADGVPGVSSFPTNTVNPIGGTASSSGLFTLTVNGTIVTPTPTAPTESIVPFTGGAEGMKHESVFGSAIIMAAAALFI